MVITSDWVGELQRVAPGEGERSTTLALGPASRGPRRLRARLMTMEGVAVTFAWAVTLLVADAQGKFFSSRWVALLEAVLLGLAGVALSWAFRLYQSRVAAMRSVTAERQGLVAVALAGLANGMQRMVVGGAPPLGPLIAGAVATFVLLVGVRSLFEAWLTFHRANGAL